MLLNCWRPSIGNTIRALEDGIQNNSPVDGEDKKRNATISSMITIPDKSMPQRTILQSQQTSRQPITLTLPSSTPASTPTPKSRSYAVAKTNPSIILPEQWNPCHDRLICALDVRDIPLQTMILVLKKSFPELAVAPLTPAFVDKRLRTLDQDITCRYWMDAISRYPKKVGAVDRKANGERDNAEH